MRRGEVWIADHGQTAKRRPVLCLMRDDLYDGRSMVIVAKVTTRIRNLQSEVVLSQADGMLRESPVNLSTLLTIPKADMERRVTALSHERMRQVERALRWVLDLDIGS